MKKIKYLITFFIIISGLTLISFGLSYDWPVQINSNSQAFSNSKSNGFNNVAPIVNSFNIITVKNVSSKVNVQVFEKNSDNFVLKLTSNPTLGTIRFDGSVVSFEPFQNKTGKEKVTFIAVDEYGNSSREGVITITINNIKPSFYYADMTNNPSHFAAIKLKENGVIEGKKIGNKYYFEPKSKVSRETLLMMAISCSDNLNKLAPCVNTGLKNDIEIPNYLKPYVKFGIEHKLITGNTFSQNEIPTRAEAVVLVSKIARLPNVKSQNLLLLDVGQIPNWALQEYMNLNAYKMLDLHGDMAYPNIALTNANAADLMWQLYKKTQVQK